MIKTSELIKTLIFFKKNYYRHTEKEKNISKFHERKCKVPSLVSIIKRPWTFVRTQKSCANTRTRLMFLIFSNIHSCSIYTIYNDNVTLATDDVTFDNVPMCSWPTSLAPGHWNEQPKSKKKEPLHPFKTFCLMLTPCYWITKWPSVSFFEQHLFNYFSFHLSAGYRFAHRHLSTILQVCKKLAW